MGYRRGYTGRREESIARRNRRRTWLEEEFMLWVFHAAYDYFFRFEEDRRLRFVKALEFSCLPLANKAAARAWKARRLRLQRELLQRNAHRGENARLAAAKETVEWLEATA